MNVFKLFGLRALLNCSELIIERVREQKHSFLVYGRCLKEEKKVKREKSKLIIVYFYIYIFYTFIFYLYFLPL